MRHRHLDVAPGTPPEEWSLAVLDDVLERGDLDDWSPIAAAARADPHGPLVKRLRSLLAHRRHYGTTPLWGAWLDVLTAAPAPPRGVGAALREARRHAGLTQAQVAARLDCGQGDVSRLEHRDDTRLSTLVAYLDALGATARVRAEFPDGTVVDVV
jgi:hypothetical protein